MLGTRNAVANLAVSDIDRARNFYTDTLGLKEVDREGDEHVRAQERRQQTSTSTARTMPAPTRPPP